MELTVADRISLLSILPTKADFATLGILKSLRMHLALTEDEFNEYGIEVNNETNRIHWKVNGIKDIPIGEVATGIIVDRLRDLDKSKELPFDLYDLYGKFIPTA